MTDLASSNDEAPPQVPLPTSKPYAPGMDRADKMELAHALNSWFATHGRDLPWRSPDCSAYAILVSEVMSQQTPVARVIPRWQDWIENWPTPAALADAAPAEVIRAWANLGYPRRALRLRDCAISCVERHRGEIPRSVPELLDLPGIGAYTARAVAAFAYGQAVPVVDTNVRRVYRRAVEGKFLAGPARARDLKDIAGIMPLVDPDPAVPAGTLGVDVSEGSSYHDAAHGMCVSLMELGALVCTAKGAPKCSRCPLAPRCAWVAAGKPEPSSAELEKASKRVQKFVGTDRQVRGKVLAKVRSAPGGQAVTRAQLDLLWPESVQLARAIDSLVSDGLLELERDGSYRLPH